MTERQILSGPAAAEDGGAPLLVFDACQVGIVLRAVVYVHGVLAVGLLYAAASFVDWLQLLAFVTGGALPATLLWLLLGCSLKTVLVRRPEWQQFAAGVVLGILCGLAACAVLGVFWIGRPKPWLACAATGALLAAGLVAGLIWRARGRTPAATAARLAELQARIRPHFLFNALNTAIALVRDEPEQAERVLEDLADLFRHALAEQDGNSTVAREVELARRYLEIEQLRFGPRLRARWELDERAGAAHLPPLILQPLVENAIRHGVEPSVDGADLRITTRLRGARAVVEVTNTVPGGQGHAGMGMALVNVRDRLRLLHDVESGFETRLAHGVYLARIEVPLPRRGFA